MSSARPTGDAPGRLGLALALLLGLVTLAVFAPARHHDFVAYDDPEYVLDNPHVREGLVAREVLWVLGNAHASNWHPLTWVSHMLDVELYGLDPAGHHVTSVLLHALNATLLCLALVALTRRPFPSVVVAALFALHPLRVESVAWIAERKDVLAGTFWLLALLAYARHARRPAATSLALVAGAFVLGAMSKPMVVTLPLVLLLLDLWPLRRLMGSDPAACCDRRVLLEKLPLLALSAALAVVTLLAQSGGGATTDLADLPLDLRALNALAALGVYLKQTLLPLGLAVHYPHPAVTADDPRAALLVPALLGGLAVVALSLVAWRLRRRAPAVLVGWLWTLVTLLPVIGLVQVGAQAHADRYTYLPLIGVVLALVFGAADLFADRPRWLRGLVAGGAGVAALLVLLTFRQLAVWSDSRTLFEHALAVTDGNYIAYAKLGELHAAEGDDERAAELYREALRLRPNGTETLTNLGVVQLRRGRLDRAQELFERVLELRGEDAAARLNLAVVHLQRGDGAGARAELERVLALGEVPQRADALFNLGFLAQDAGDSAAAEARYREALATDARHAAALNNLGDLRLRQGDAPEAARLFEQLVRLEPEDPYAWLNLGVARTAAGDTVRARQALERALALEPGLEAASERLRQLDG